MAASKNKLPKQVTLSTQEADDLMQRLQSNKLSTKDIEILQGLIAFNAWLQERLSRAKLTVKKLRQLFGFKSESSKKSNNDNAPDDSKNKSETSSEENSTNDSAPSTSAEQKSPENKTSKWDPKQNHGRLAASEYTGCPVIEVNFIDEILKSGFCPICAEADNETRLEYPYPSVLVFLVGSPLVSGTRVELKNAKCSICETYFKADLPEEFKDLPKYSETAISQIAIQHYYAGQPFKRIETLQKAQGVPLADSTQYDLMDILYQTAVKPIIAALRFCASNGHTFYFDDTTGRIIDQTARNKKAAKRQDKKSVHATAILSEYEGHRIYLFQTNTQTAGKSFADLITQRALSASFITMSDASSHNFPELEDTLLARWVISLCLSHGRRKIHELIDDSGGDDEYRLILDIIADVYLNERHCKDLKLTDEARLLYHQKHSAPLMKALFNWLNNLLLYKEVEPNSRFGEAITYLVKRWEYLTQFLQTPGAPLDNNICEIAIKVLIRYRNNSRSYKTFYGATVGDAIMSVLHTAMAANINPFDYLNALQLNAKAVQAEPEKWLPWNFEQALQLQANLVAHR